MLNPTVITYVIGGLVFLGVLWAKGYLGLGDIFTAASVARPGSLMPKASSKDLFSRAVKVAMEEAHEEIAGKMADQMRSQVVASHLASFPGSGPSAPPAPDASPAAPPAS